MSISMDRVQAPPTVPSALADAAKMHPDRTAIIDHDVEFGFAELGERARSFAAALVADGVRPGDRVAILAFNCHEWVTAFLGVAYAGATLIPVSTRFKGLEAADVLARGRVRVLVTVTDFLGNDYVEMLRGTDVPLPDLRTVVVARGHVPASAVGWDRYLARAGEAEFAEADRRAAAVGPEDPSDLLFTSGTTGRPKGVLMCQAAALAVGTDWVAMTGLHAGDRYLMVNPYFHMFGLKAGILACLASGATMMPVPVFDVTRVLELVAERRVTVLPGPPTLYQSILDRRDRGGYDLSSLRVAVTGAADIPVELIRRIRAELPFSLVVSGYGLTEAGTASSTGPGDDPETIATTVGRPRPGFEIRILDAGGTEVSPGIVGEIALRGPSIMSGYVDDPEATAAVLSPDNWLRTGDLGMIDQRGCLRISGRAKDMFIVGGFNAYPAEIESILLRNPAIAQAAVIGVPDVRLGEVGVAFVVPRPGRAPTGADVIAWSRENMANYKVPRHVEVVDALPLTASGKVAKRELRDRAGQAARTAAAGS